jgi:Uma2 family endonuclease
MTVQSKIRMTVSEFFSWAERQPEGKFELSDGEVIAMSPERVRRSMVKGAVYRALADAIEEARLTCVAYPDGPTFVIDETTARVPDVSVECGIDQDPDSMVLKAPVVLVEVLSPSSERTDNAVKLVEYFSLPSVRHFVIVDPWKNAVVHHASTGNGPIMTRIFREGEIELSAPGMRVAVSRLLGNV